LINEVDNGGDGTLYVRSLRVNEGSTLDLNGLTLYYGSLAGGGQIAANGGRVQAIPEPACMVGLLLGGVAVIGRPRRQSPTRSC
jgi:hypothetical protein